MVLKVSQLVMDTAKPVLCDEPKSVVNLSVEVPGDVNNLTLYRTSGVVRKKIKK